jgi:hypothetical protein
MRQGSDKAAIGRMAGALAGLLLAVAQPARAADELPGVPMPDVEISVPEVEVAPPEVEVDVGRVDIGPPRPYPAPRGAYAAIPPVRYGGMIERPTVSPYRIATMLRATGFSLLGRIEQRGWIYTVAVLDPNGDDGRAIIDARTGAMIKFIPAQAVTARLKEDMATIYGPPGPPPMRDLRHAPRPPVNMPRVASRTPAATPLPRARRDAMPAQQAAKPISQHAAIKPKPAAAPETAAPAAASAPAAQPAEVELKPTQEMPPVQTLE